MATLTTNLFRGQGERDHLLDVVEGRWPTDIDGWIFIVGPDKAEPGGHWFAAPGLLCRIDCAPSAGGQISVRHRRVGTPMESLRRRWPKLFRSVQFLEVSPLGFTNMANTNVEAIDGRLFIGFDAGRPVEVDPVTLEYVTAVGRTDEWLASAPGLLDPLISVAAHPAAAPDERALYFVNYSVLPPQRPSLARWPLNGPVERWPLTGMSRFDSIHDVKATRDHLVITDLPFVVEPEAMRSGARTKPNQDVTRLWIVAKEDLRSTTPGDPVAVVEVELPMPTGHVSVDYEDEGDELVVYLEHIPVSDLMIRIGPDSVDHRSGQPFGADYEGLIALAVQPGAIGRYRVDARTGEVLDRDVAWDDRFWGGVLTTRDDSTPAARARRRDAWFAGIGFDPDLVPEDWFQLYAPAGNTTLVPLDELPVSGRPGALAHFDLDTMKVAAVHELDAGAFPSPPTFVPRRGAQEPGDGYVVVLVHRDGHKELQVFDAQHIDDGPVARASTPDFNPSLPLHSCWMPERAGARPSTYRVPVTRDLAAAARSTPGVIASFRDAARAIREEIRSAGAVTDSST